MDTDARRISFAGKTEFQKRPPPGMAGGALLPVYRKLEVPLDESCHRLHDPPRGGFAAHVDHEIIRIAHEAQGTLFQLFVKLVQHDVG